MTSNPSTWLAIVTGASRGFGRFAALEFASQVAKTHPLHLVLIARSADGLKGTTDAVSSENGERGEHAHAVTVAKYVVDLANLDTLEKDFSDVLQKEITGASRCYSRAFLCNNAASLGVISPVASLNSLSDLRACLDFNVTSAMWVTSAFSKAVATSARSDGRNVVINVSSLAAIQPIRTWAAYCAGKAARDMWHRTLAAEQNEGDETDAKAGENARFPLAVLNYAPGPMDTDMQKDFRRGDEPGSDPELLAAFRQMDRDGKYVDTRTSAAKMVRLALKTAFENGAHIDYYDEEP